MIDSTEAARAVAESSRFGVLELGPRTWLVIERLRPTSFERHGTGPWHGSCLYRVVFRGPKREAFPRYQAERRSEGTW